MLIDLLSPLPGQPPVTGSIDRSGDPSGWRLRLILVFQALYW